MPSPGPSSRFFESELSAGDLKAPLFYLVAVLAMPARRAASVDPGAALRAP